MSDAAIEVGAIAVKGESIKRGLDLTHAECRALAHAALAAALEKSENAEIKRLQILVRDWQDSSEAYRRDFEAASSPAMSAADGIKS